MNLTEGQLFTIEALNRIEGFVWPEGAKFATFDRGYTSVNFWTDKPTANNPKFFGHLESSVYVNAYHPDWRNSLITREQFDSVDGWVLGLAAPVPNDIPKCGIEIEFGKFGRKWRYRKQTKETEMQQPKQFKNRDNIETLIDKRKDAIEQKRIALAALEEAEAKERELMLSIQAWAESYGFDIRVLDESDEVPEVEPKSEPELVITDWRDLRVGDEIWWSGGAGFSSGQYIISEVSKKGVSVTTWKGQSWLDVLNTAWKFIRRPCK